MCFYGKIAPFLASIYGKMEQKRVKQRNYRIKGRHEFESVFFLSFYDGDIHLRILYHLHIGQAVRSDPDDIFHGRMVIYHLIYGMHKLFCGYVLCRLHHV